MKKKIILAIVFIIFAFLRIIHLPADAPTALSWGRGPFTDEGFYAHNARNKVLFDSWSMDDYNYHFVSPVMGVLNFIAFKTMGVKYSSIRLVAVFFSCLTMFLVFVLVKRKYDEDTAVLSGFFMSFAYFGIMYHRLFISEIPMLFFLMFTLYFLDQGKKRDYFMAGICFLLALLAKSLALHFIAVIAWILWQQRQNGFWQKARWFFTGAITIAVVWLVFLVWPDPEKFFSFYRIFVARISPKYLHQVYKVFNAEYFAYVPVLTALALVAVRWHQSFGDLEKLAGVWLAAGIAFLMLFSYTTTAYYLILFIPTVILVCGFIYKVRHRALAQRSSPFWFNAIWLFCGYFIFRYIVLFYFRDIFFQSLAAKLALEVITVLIVAGLWRFSSRLAYYQWRLVITGTIVLFLLIDFAPYLQWVVAPHYVVQDTMRDLQSKIPQGTVAGPWAPTLCLETSLREFPFGETVVNAGRLKEKTSLTHLLLERREEELGFIRQNYPALLARSTIVATYFVDNKIIDLWKLAHD
ncbi:MAG: glycosyltransferase family 39 protein [bacterium]|nr:glycosyltransferase family 39 protein [bacterium]